MPYFTSGRKRVHKIRAERGTLLQKGNNTIQRNKRNSPVNDAHPRTKVRRCVEFHSQNIDVSTSTYVVWSSKITFCLVIRWDTKVNRDRTKDMKLTLTPN